MCIDQTQIADGIRTLLLSLSACSKVGVEFALSETALFDAVSNCVCVTFRDMVSDLMLPDVTLDGR